ncbi:MAG: hypothetical protein KF805_08405 [Phycisphaeraceae bacterium]|nr:hypothetical protein [Phycisphaeraceae bacterium]
MSQEDALDAIRDSLESSRVKIRNKVYQRIVILDPPVERSASRFGGKRGEKAIEYAFAYAYPGHHKIFRFTIFNGSVVDVEQRTIEEGEHRLALPLLETLDES